MNRADRHNELELNLLDSGSLTYLLGGRRVTLRPRRLSAFWAATPHQILDSQDLTFYYVVTVPLAWVLGWGLPESLVERLLGGAVVEEPEARPRTSTWRASRSGTRTSRLAGTAARRRSCSSSRRACCAWPRRRRRPARRARGARWPRPAGARPPASSGWRPSSRATTWIGSGSRRWRGRSGCTRDYASALFRKVFGVTPTRFILQHRVSHAQRMLVTSDAKILEVAMDSGFGSLSRFNAAFRQLCGCPPRQYRSLHRV